MKDSTVGWEFFCPFCGARCGIVDDEKDGAVVHALPPCPTFIKEEPEEYLRLVNEKIRRTQKAQEN